MNQEQPRKRNRLSLACIICKKRKVRCDRGRPCNSCIKYNVANSCEYQESSWSGKSLNGNYQGVFKSGPQLHEESLKRSEQPISLAPPLAKHPTFSLHHPKYKNFDQLTSSFKVSDTFTPSSDSSELNHNSLSHSAASLNTTTSTEPVIQSELEKLKDKIKQIEASIAVANLSNPSYSNSSTPVHQDASSSVQRDLPLSNGQGLSKNILVHPSSSTQYDERRIKTLSSMNALCNNDDVQLPPINMLNSTTKISFQSIPPPTEEESPNNSKCSHDEFGVYGFNPVESEKCAINFFEGYSAVYMKESRTMNHGPLSWITIMLKDPALNFLWGKVIKMKQKKNIFPHDRSEKLKRKDTTVISNNEEQFRDTMYENEGITDIQPYKEMSKKLKTHKMKDTLPLGISFHGHVESELEFVEKIKAVLPKQKVIWLLFEIFFECLYSFMPFFDHDKLKETLERIIGKYGLEDSHIECVAVEKRLDFASIGTILLMIRFAYLSLLSNNPILNDKNLNSPDSSPEAQTLRYLLQNPITFEIVDCAQACLNQFRLLRKSSLEILQCAILMRLYHIYSPEEGDGSDGGDSQIFNGMLIQMANSIGINRDPSKLNQVITDEKTINIWRKLWYQLVYFDMVQGSALGNPTSIQSKFYDTKLPIHLPSVNENNNDQKIEATVINNFKEMNVIHEKVSKILEIILDVKGTTHLYILANYMNDIENHLMDNYKSLDYLLTSYDSKDSKSDVIAKVLKVKMYLQLKTFLATIYHYMYLHYEETKNVDLAFFYFKKMLINCSIDILPRLKDLITRPETFFGPGYDIMITPLAELAYSRTVHIHISAIVRTRLCLISLTFENRNSNPFQDGELQEKIVRLCNLFIETSESGIRAMSTISDRYYYAWRMTKAQNFIVKLVKDDEFYQNDNPNEDIRELAENNVFMAFDLDKLDQLTSIITSANDKQDESKKSRGIDSPSSRQMSKKLSSSYHTSSLSITNSPFNDGSEEISSTTVSSTGNDANFKTLQTPTSLIDDQEIDFNWLQMISNKSNCRFFGESIENFSTPCTQSNNHFGAAGDNTDASNATVVPWNPFNDLNDYFKDESSPFDIFGDLPFERMINWNNFNN